MPVAAAGTAPAPAPQTAAVTAAAADSAAASTAGGRTVILASTSPRRIELLSRCGVRFRALPAAVDESAVRGEPETVARTLALAKARWSRRRALAEGEEASRLWVLGADTVVELDGEVLGKPADDDDARRILRRLSGRAHEVLTAVAVIGPDGRERVEVEVSEVAFRKLDDAEIDAYVRSGDPGGKAGAYGIQGGGAALVEWFRGCHANVVGLPVRRALRLLGLEPPPCDCAERPGQRGRSGCGERW
jgi:septum formation protein